MALSVCVLIVTRDRKDLAHRAVESARSQRDLQRVLVIDDGSADGTHASLAEAFPDLDILRSPYPRGSIAQRNRGTALAHTDIVIGLDDDAYFSDQDAVANAVAAFSDPRVGAVALTEGLRPTRLGHGDDFPLAPAFVGCGYAVRREQFMALGGFREHLVAYGEERDFCLRLIDAGYVVRQGLDSSVVHEPAGNRNWHGIARLSRRNDVLHVWQNVPFPYTPLHALGLFAGGLKIGLMTRTVPWQVEGFALGLRDCFKAGEYSRSPVRKSAYRMARAIANRPDRRRFSAWSARLPVLASVSGPGARRSQSGSREAA
jgi:GT2 family glycosyltransferase